MECYIVSEHVPDGTIKPTTTRVYLLLLGNLLLLLWTKLDG